MVSKVFISYAQADKRYCDSLIKHLEPLKLAGELDSWHDGLIAPGADHSTVIRQYLDEADLILLLITPDYFASPNCSQDQLSRALKRHTQNEARVIPVITRACEWQVTPLGKLKPLPRDGRAITAWDQEDDAWSEVISGIRTALGLAMARQDQPHPLNFSNEATAKLVRALEAAQLRHEELTVSGADTSAALEDILTLQRKLREGGVLKPGDFLSKGRFRLLEHLGQGGFSSVFKAYDRQSRQLVAVKVLHSQRRGPKSP